MTALDYLALEHQVKRLETVVNDIRGQKLMPNSATQWDDVMINARAGLAVELTALSDAEQAELARQRRLERQELEHKARLARERGRGAFGATYTGD